MGRPAALTNGVYVRPLRASPTRPGDATSGASSVQRKRGRFAKQGTYYLADDLPALGCHRK